MPPVPLPIIDLPHASNDIGLAGQRSILAREMVDPAILVTSMAGFPAGMIKPYHASTSECSGTGFINSPGRGKSILMKTTPVSSPKEMLGAYDKHDGDAVMCHDGKMRFHYRPEKNLNAMNDFFNKCCTLTSGMTQRIFEKNDKKSTCIFAVAKRDGGKPFVSGAITPLSSDIPRTS
jgi:hypothetical protein